MHLTNLILYICSLMIVPIAASSEHKSTLSYEENYSEIISNVTVENRYLYGCSQGQSLPAEIINQLNAIYIYTKDTHKNISDKFSDKIITEEMTHWEFVKYSNILMIKMIVEYIDHDFHTMSITLQTILRYLTNVFALSDDRSFGRHWLLQQKLYDILYSHDIIRYADEHAQKSLYSYLEHQSNAYRYIDIEINKYSTNDKAAEYLSHIVSSNSVSERIYTHIGFMATELKHLRAFYTHVVKHLDSNRSLYDYKSYKLTGGGKIPGRRHSHNAIIIAENIMRHDYTRRNRSLILLWALLTYKHYEMIGGLPPSISDIDTKWILDECNITYVSTRSLITGCSIDFFINNNSFKITGGPEYRAFSGTQDGPSIKTIYFGCV